MAEARERSGGGGLEGDGEGDGGTGEPKAKQRRARAESPPPSLDPQPNPPHTRHSLPLSLGSLSVLEYFSLGLFESSSPASSERASERAVVLVEEEEEGEGEGAEVWSRGGRSTRRRSVFVHGGSLLQALRLLVAAALQIAAA